MQETLTFPYETLTYLRRPAVADIDESNPKIIEFEPVPEAAPVETPSEAPAPAPAEPVPA